MQTQKKASVETHNIEMGLKGLTLYPEKDSEFKMLSPSNSSAGSLGDYIGTESCLDLKKSINEEISYCNQVHYRRSQRWSMKEREFPPPIPLLARTENQPSHMPWILKRHYTSDGRLVLIEEKVRHHEYFRAQRSNGHLTLQLVHLDDNVLVPPFVQEDEETTLVGGDDDDDDDNEIGVDEEEEMLDKIEEGLEELALEEQTTLE